MLVKDIEKEGFIHFYERSKNEEVSQEEYDELIRQAYISQLKYKGLAGINPILKEKFEKLEFRTKRIKNIRKIYLVMNARFYRRRKSAIDSFIVVENEKNIIMLYDLTTGEDFSFEFVKKIEMNDNTKIVQLYDYKNDYQVNLDISYMDNISFYKEAILINSFNDFEVSKSDFLVFNDRCKNKIILDLKNNKIYMRQNNYKLVSINKTKKVYEFHKSKRIEDIFKHGKFLGSSLRIDFFDCL